MHVAAITKQLTSDHRFRVNTGLCFVKKLREVPFPVTAVTTMLTTQRYARHSDNETIDGHRFSVNPGLCFVKKKKKKKKKKCVKGAWAAGERLIIMNNQIPICSGVIENLLLILFVVVTGDE